MKKIKKEDSGGKKDFAILFNLFHFFKRMLSNNIPIAIRIEFIFDQNVEYVYEQPQEDNRHIYIIRIISSTKDNIEIKKFYHGCKTMFCLTEIDRQFISEIEKQENLLKNHLMKSDNTDFDFLYDTNVTDIEKTKKLLELTDFNEYMHSADLQDVIHTVSNFYLIFLHHGFDDCYHYAKFLKFTKDNISGRNHLGTMMNNELQKYCRNNSINTLDDTINMQDYMNNIKCSVQSILIEIVAINYSLSKMSDDDFVDSKDICKIIESYVNNIQNYINEVSIKIDHIGWSHPRYIGSDINRDYLETGSRHISSISDIIKKIDPYTTSATLKNALKAINESILEACSLQGVITIPDVSYYMVEKYYEDSVLLPESDLEEANSSSQEECLYISF